MSEFNFKSQICTDKNKSERLLALGLKKETADCYLVVEKEEVTVVAKPYYEIIEDLNSLPFDAEIIPAWSLGRLVEMMPNTIHNKRILAYLRIMNDRVLYDTIKNETYSAFTNNNGLFAAVVDAVEWLIKEGYFNKEYFV